MKIKKKPTQGLDNDGRAGVKLPLESSSELSSTDADTESKSELNPLPPTKTQRVSKRITSTTVKDLDSGIQHRKGFNPIPKTAKWENRIVETGEADPTTLVGNPYNFRRHPLDQQRYMTAVLARVGWISEIIVNKRSGRIIDGHLRAAIAAANNEKRVPVKYVDLDEGEEMLALATFDRMGEMADIDTEALDDLLEDVDVEGNKYLHDLFQSFSTDYELEWGKREFEEAVNGISDGLGSGVLETVLSDSSGSVGEDSEGKGSENGDGGEGDGGEGSEDKEIEIGDWAFPTDNEWQIPVLKLGMAPIGIDMPLLQWGVRSAKLKNAGGSWQFYIWDKKFAHLWDDPTPVVNSGVSSIFEINFSVTPITPPVIALYRIYQKRWLSRFFQEHGIKVFADLHVPPVYKEWNKFGIPKGYSAFSTRCYQHEQDIERALREDFETAREISGKDDPLFVVVHGYKKVAALCAKMGWLHVMEHHDAARVQHVSETTLAHKQMYEKKSLVKKKSLDNTD